jgi:hypothetical protein
MLDDGWSLWKLGAIGMAIVMAVALISGLVVANWSGPVPMPTLPAPPAETVPLKLPAAGRLLPASAVPPKALEAVGLLKAIEKACAEYATQLDQAQPIRSAAVYAICLRARSHRR